MKSRPLENQPDINQPSRCVLDIGRDEMDEALPNYAQAHMSDGLEDYAGLIMQVRHECFGKSLMPDRLYVEIPRQ